MTAGIPLTGPMDPGTPLPSGRSIISVKMCAGGCGDGDCPAVLIGCDCAATTHLVVEDAGRLPPGYQAAFTCDGCHSAHWFTIMRTVG